MKKLLFTITLFFVQINFAFTPIEKGDLIFEIIGFENNDGKAVLYLFREEDELPEKPFKIVSVFISDKAASLDLKELEYGEYALIIFHDVPI